MVIWKDFGIAFFADIAVFYYLINLYHVTDLFQPPPLTHLKTSGFLIISVGIERDQWHEMD